jgi:NIMA-interacting peptidyl-prolyl cis-trans isomerase 4
MAPKGKGGDKGKAADKGAEKKGGAQKGAQSINVRHILCEKHAKKEEALKKLNDGVAFNKVAEEYSEDKARAGEMHCGCFSVEWDDLNGDLALTMISGGSLGWKGKGALLPEFEKVAFELEVSSIGSPKWAEYVSPAHVLMSWSSALLTHVRCKTSEGYHILMVEGRK